VIASIRVTLGVWLVLGLLAGAARADTQGSQPELGLWLSQDHNGVFSITPCGQQLCGRMVGMRYTGPVPKDVNGASECNILMLTGFNHISDDDDAWEGHILDPDTGHVYHARIWSPTDGVLKLRGYVGIPLFGETQTWTRFAGPIGPDCAMR